MGKPLSALKLELTFKTSAIVLQGSLTSVSPGQLPAHSCFGPSVNFGAATMENGFQVTVLDLEAL